VKSRVLKGRANDSMLAPEQANARKPT